MVTTSIQVGGRRSGRTTAAILSAPPGATYVCCNEHFNPVKKLAKDLGRADLAGLWFVWNGVVGYEKHIVVDHATHLSDRELDQVAEVNRRATARENSIMLTSYPILGVTSGSTKNLKVSPPFCGQSVLDMNAMNTQMTTNKVLWCCYAIDDDGSYHCPYLSVTCVDETIEAVQLAFEMAFDSSLTFIWAEPISKSEKWFEFAFGYNYPRKNQDILDRLIFKESLDRLRQLVDVGNTSTPGPRKPVPALRAEVHSQTQFDAKSAWEAVRALSRGT